MSQWAIEADQLVKKFARRSGPEAAPQAAVENGSAKPERPARKGPRWPWQRTPAGWFTAVDGVSLAIEKGEIFGMLGPNGAGKSTTIRMLCTLLEPTSGTARVNGYDVYDQANLVRQSLGTVLAGERSVYWKLTARENLEYFAALYHIPNPVARARIDELLKRMELEAKSNELVEKFSTGMRQRVSISKALLSRPPVLLLDEPTLGLDPQAARRLRELILELKAEGHTILLTTHYMEEADQLCDRIAIIDTGKVIALDTPAQLKRTIQQKDIIRLEVSGWHEEMAQPISRLPGIDNLVSRRMENDSLWEVNLQAGNSRAVLPGIIEQVNRNGTHLVNMKVVEPSLEDVFIHLTGKALRD